MSNQVQINESQSERLHQIASEKGEMPDGLLEEALELIFQQTEREKVILEEQALLEQLESEDDGSLHVVKRPPFNKNGLTVTHSVLAPELGLHNELVRALPQPHY